MRRLPRGRRASTRVAATAGMVASLLGSALAAGSYAAAPAAPPPAVVRPAAVDPAGVTLAAPVLANGFAAPVAVASPRDDSGHLFVVEKAGTIQIVDQATGTRIGQYADLTARVDPAGEQGLLGMAFDPAFTSGRPFVYLAFVSNQDQALRVVRFRPTGGDPAATTLDTSSNVGILSIPHSTADNHYAGTVAFGPDGLLYISTGDGGSTPQNAQNLFSLSGKILRIDPRRSEGGKPYAIPPGNPFRYGRYGRPEIWLWGLRNPYRFSIDFYNGNVWVADVGQSTMEEVSVRKTYTAGANLGWDCREGTIAYPYSRSTCPGAGPYLGPRIAYGRGFGHSITGGYVYRGQAYAQQLYGLYVFADFFSGRGVVHDPNGPLGNLHEKLTISNVTGFGEGDRRELFLTTYGGELRKVTAS